MRVDSVIKRFGKEKTRGITSAKMRSFKNMIPHEEWKRCKKQWNE